MCHQVQLGRFTTLSPSLFREAEEEHRLENPLTDLLSSKITDYYFLIRLHPPPPSFPSHPFIIIRLSPRARYCFDGWLHDISRVYFICNAKKKLTIVLNFSGIRRILFSQKIVQFQATENSSVLKLLTLLCTICGKSRRRNSFDLVESIFL